MNHPLTERKETNRKPMQKREMQQTIQPEQVYHATFAWRYYWRATLFNPQLCEQSKGYGYALYRLSQTVPDDTRNRTMSSVEPTWRRQIQWPIWAGWMGWSKRRVHPRIYWQCKHKRHCTSSSTNRSIRQRSLHPYHQAMYLHPTATKQYQWTAPGGWSKENHIFQHLPQNFESWL